jgi:hypothetical protein
MLLKREVERIKLNILAMCTALTIKRLIQTIEAMEKTLEWYELQEPDYAGADEKGDPICVMHARWDNGTKAREILKAYRGEG